MIYMLMFHKKMSKIMWKSLFYHYFTRGALQTELGSGWLIFLKLMDLFTQVNVHLLPLRGFPPL